MATAADESASRLPQDNIVAPARPSDSSSSSSSVSAKKTLHNMGLVFFFFFSSRHTVFMYARVIIYSVFICTRQIVDINSRARRRRFVNVRGRSRHKSNGKGRRNARAPIATRLTLSHTSSRPAHSHATIFSHSLAFSLSLRRLIIRYCRRHRRRIARCYFFSFEIFN